MTNYLIRLLLKCLIPAILMVSSAVAANTEEMDEAVNKYYAGYPDEAISMIKPLALSGNVDAQYLLGNILYSLSEDGKLSTSDDPVKWYKMAVEQNSADAAYALGAIFHNRWIKSRDKKDAANAIVYYQDAAELGSQKSHEPLKKVISRSGISLQKARALAKQEDTTSIPKSESTVQIAKSETGTFENDKTLAPKSDSLAKNKATDAANKPTVEKPGLVVQTANKTDAASASTITLADITKRCQNYTEKGFNLYAETIEGALFSGEVSMESFELDPSQSGTYSVGLSHKQMDLAIFLDLRDVPKDVAVAFKKGNKYAVTGIIVVSKATGSDCIVSASYQSVED